VESVELIADCLQGNCRITANVLGATEDGQLWAGSGETTKVVIDISVAGLLGQAFPSDLLSAAKFVGEQILNAMKSALGKALGLGTTLTTDLVQGAAVLKVTVVPLDQAVGDVETDIDEVEQLRDLVTQKLTTLDCLTPFRGQLNQANKLIAEANELKLMLAQRNLDNFKTVRELLLEIRTKLREAKALVDRILDALKPSITFFSLKQKRAVLEPGQSAEFNVEASHICGDQAITFVEIIDTENVGVFTPSRVVNAVTLKGEVKVDVPKLDKTYDVTAVVTDATGEIVTEIGRIKVKQVRPELRFEDVSGDPGEKVELKLIVIHKNADGTPNGKKRIRDTMIVSSPSGLNTTPQLGNAKWNKTHDPSTGTFTFTTKVKIADVHRDKTFTLNSIKIEESSGSEFKTTGKFTVNDVAPDIAVVRADPKAIRPITTETETVARVEITVDFTDKNGFDDVTQIDLTLSDKTQADFVNVDIMPPTIFSKSIVGTQGKGTATFVVTVTYPKKGILVFSAQASDILSCSNGRCADSDEVEIPIVNKPPDFRGRGSTRLPPEDEGAFEQPPDVTCPGDIIRVVIGFSDPNNDMLSVTATAKLKGESRDVLGPVDLENKGLTPSGQATRYLLEFPAPPVPGRYVISIVASDGELSVEHHFEFTVRSPEFCSRENTNPLTVGLKGPKEGMIGQSITFVLTANDVDGISLIELDWGDASSRFTPSGPFGPEFSQSLAHTYAKEGTFTITLTAVETFGVVGTATHPVTIRNSIPHFSQKVEIGGTFVPVAPKKEFIDSVAKGRERVKKDLGGQTCVTLPFAGQICQAGTVAETVAGVRFELAPEGTEFDGMKSTNLPKGLELDPETGALVSFQDTGVGIGTFKPLIRAVDTKDGGVLAELWIDLTVGPLIKITITPPSSGTPTSSPDNDDTSSSSDDDASNAETSTDLGENTKNKPPVVNAGGGYSGTVPCTMISVVLLCKGSVTISFNGTGHDPDGNITKWTWNFGDGSSVVGPPQLSHTYNVEFTGSSTSFNACLTATDNDGAKATSCTTVTISGVNTGGSSSSVVGEERWLG